ncbi:MAG: cobalamin-binding protein [Desulfobacteraceae bacterium]|nr:cobalamin-binding protein [Desulfobacteraceae bacterium]
MMNVVNDFMQALLNVDRLLAKKIIDDHVSIMHPIQLIEDIVVVALERIGTGWQDGTYALSQVYMSGRICEEVVDTILPPSDPDRKDQPKMAICVLSDHHKLGKTIVYSLLRASGFELLDFDIVEVNDMVARVKEQKIKILLISVLMLPSALKIKKVKKIFKDEGLDTKIIVGGAPFRFDDQLWQEVGADAMCETASEAVSVVHNLMECVS